MDIKDINLSLILDSIEDGIYITDNKREIIYWNKGAEIITGFKSEEVLGKFCKNNILNHIDENGINMCQGLCPLGQTLIDGRKRNANLYLHHKDGYRIPVEIEIIPIIQDEIITGAIEIFKDASYKQKIEKELEEYKKLALLDTDTQIPNKYFLELKLDKTINEVKNFDYSYGIIMVKIENIEQINKNYSIEIGEKIIKMIANNVYKNTRSSDYSGKVDYSTFAIITRFITSFQFNELMKIFYNTSKNSFVMNDGEFIAPKIKLVGKVFDKNSNISKDKTFLLLEEALYNSEKDIKLL